ncbi:MAG: hypothetical protein CR984_02965 [Proteobacteria bacterium]|nr:MAG: hypothetical protein CR984_02965 [Pseudomonadota bacterium]
MDLHRYERLIGNRQLEKNPEESSFKKNASRPIYIAPLGRVQTDTFDNQLKYLFLNSIDRDLNYFSCLQKISKNIKPGQKN